MFDGSVANFVLMTYMEASKDLKKRQRGSQGLNADKLIEDRVFHLWPIPTARHESRDKAQILKVLREGL